MRSTHCFSSPTQHAFVSIFTMGCPLPSAVCVLNVMPFITVVSFASPLVTVVGKKTVVPLVFLGEIPGPGETINGDMLPIFVNSSMKLPFPNGEFTKVAEVGIPWGLIPTRAWGEGGGRVGVLGREPGIMVGGARLNGEKTWPVGTFLKSVKPMPECGARRVGVIGVTPLVAAVPKNWVPNIPGEIGIPCAGKMNFVISLSELWFSCCC